MALNLLRPFGRYALNVLIGIDQLGTTLIGGHPDETLSSYAHRMRLQGKPSGVAANVIDALFFWEDDHCRKAYESEKARRQTAPELR